MAWWNRGRVRPALAGTAAGGSDGASAVPMASADAAQERPEAVRRIAVFLQNRARYGTLVCHIPLLNSLRRRFPSARLTVVARFDAARMLVGPGLADALCAWPANRWAQFRTVRRLDADVLITLRPASGFLDLLVGLSGAPIRLGFATAVGRRLFSAAPERDLATYRPLNYLRVVEALGVAPALSAHLEELAGAAGPGLDPALERYCLLPGGASPFKLWGIDNFLTLAVRLRATRPAARFVIVLGPDERLLRAAIDASPIAAVTDVLDAPSLGALAQAILASRATIANDCGPSHVAQLLGVPYVGLFANHRCQAERVARQWFRPRPTARWIAPPSGSPITAIRVEDVEARLREVIR